MSKAKRLLAAVLCVIMALSMVTFSAFAADKKVFADDYVAPEVQEGSAVVKSTAVMITGKAKNRPDGTEITAAWDGTDYTFVVGENAFSADDFKMAVTQADVLADGGIPQILLDAGTYPELNIDQSIQIFGTHWNDNPNVVNTSDPTKTWALNSAWNSNVTYVNDVIINASANGIIDIYGIQISHRFYDSFRSVSAIKTVLTLRNIHFYQTDKSTDILSVPSGRSYEKCAMSFWNPNSYNTAATAQYNKDETHLINFRVGKLDMNSSGDNRLIDERVSPIFVMDGFCADYAGGNIRQFFWMKWMDGFTRTRCEVKNSYFAFARTGNSNNAFDYEGFLNNKDTDTSIGEWSEISFTNNIFYNTLYDNGTPNIRVYQSEYDLVSFKDNLFVSTKGGAASLINWASVGGGDLSDAVEMIDNTFLGYASVYMSLGSSATKIDMTGSHIQEEYASNYATKSSNILPTGNVRYDYCYIDGARTIRTTEVQPFTVDDAVIDEDAKTMLLAAADGFYYKTPKVNGLVEWEIYESDAEFSNYDNFSESTQLARCVLKNKENYFLFVVYSLDKSNYVVYKLTVTRPDPAGLVLIGIDANVSVTVDGIVCTADIDKDTDSVTFAPVVGSGVTYRVNDLSTGFTLTPDAEGYYTLANLRRGVTNEYRIELARGTERQYYTLVVARPYNTAAEIISVGNNVTEKDGGYVATVGEGASQLAFDIKVSDDAQAYVWAGTNVYSLKDGKITIADPVAGEYTLAVVAEDGVTSKTYPFTIKTVESSEAKVISVEGAVAKDGGFVASARSFFFVDATVSAGADYAVYSDAACTTLLEDDLVIVEGEPVTVYIVVTAADGTVAAPVALTVSKITAGITVEGAVAAEAGDSVMHLLVLEEDVKSTTLNITADGCTYKLFADIGFTVPASNKLKLDQAITLVYAELTFADGTKTYDVIEVTSPRTPVAYKDAKSIPGWAKKYVDLLNDGGLGMLQGDANGNFNPANGMTRYEIAAVATRIMGVDASQFASVKLPYVDSIQKWAANYVKAVTALGIMTGSKNADGKLEFNGSATTTRSQLAKIVVDIGFAGSGVTSSEFYSAMKDEVDAVYNEYAFADDAQVQKWARPYVRLAVYTGLFEGSTVDGKNYIKANDDIKRQEIAVVIAMIYGLGDE